MIWYIQLIFYIIFIGISLMVLWFVDFAKFIRSDKREYAIYVYILLSLALGFILGQLFIEIGTLLINAIK